MLWKRDEDGKLNRLATGTGFTVVTGGRRFLVTNLHNLRGKDFDGNHLGGHAVEPTHIGIEAENGLFPTNGRVRIIQALYDAHNQPLWFQHPKDPRCDVAVLEITKGEGRGYMYAVASKQLEKSNKVAPGWHDWEMPQSSDLAQPRPSLRPSDSISIVGFPFGFRSKDGFPIWINGSLASEPDVDYDDRPAFLIDARTREGQSGSPAILHLTPNGRPTLFTDGSVRSYGREMSFLLGIYSGRLNKNSDLGIVWRTEVIQEILDSIPHIE